jgi:hypothetical protein
MISAIMVDMGNLDGVPRQPTSRRAFLGASAATAALAVAPLVGSAPAAADDDDQGLDAGPGGPLVPQLPAPDWTHVIRVGDVTTATIDLAKDNVQFGVRAVDRDGHRSPAASPTPI